MDAVTEDAWFAGQTFHGVVIEDHADNPRIIHAHHHHAPAGESVVEPDVVFVEHQPKNHRVGVDVDDISGGDEGPELVHCRMEPVVEGFEQYGGIWL